MLATAVFSPSPLSGRSSHPSRGGRPWENPSYRSGTLPSFISTTKAPSMGSQHSGYQTWSPLKELSTDSLNMSTLALRTPSLLPSPRQLLWDDRPPRELPMAPQVRVELPSIRLAIPEIQMRPDWSLESEYRTDSKPRSPPTGPGPSLAPPEYVPSPSVFKRRKLSIEEDRDYESRDPVVPRIYGRETRPFRSQSLVTSPKVRPSVFSKAESWAASARTSPFMSTGRFAENRSPQLDSLNSSRSEWRPTLPSLQNFNLDRGVSQVPRERSGWGESGLEVSHSDAKPHPQPSTAFDPRPYSSRASSVSYGPQQPRGQSFSGPSTVPRDSSPLSSRSKHPGYAGGNAAYGHTVNDESEGKQRKRRGNLPKETTDKLRAWFVAHLQHPYPTEDQKQELMRQTGLQINQISNWFINARRRQLPAMISSAQAETDARSSRASDRDNSTSDYGDDRDGTSVPLGESEGEGSGFEVEFEQIRSRRAGQELLKRGSI